MFPGGKMPGEDFIFSFYPIVIALTIGLIIGFRNYMRGGQCASEEKMKGKTVIVTGANTGIGYEIARDLVGRGARVILACRDEQKGKTAVKELKEATEKDSLIFMKLDLACFESIKKFVQDFKEKEEKLHVLINNAGIMCNPISKSADGHEIHLATNYLGPFMLTMMLIDMLKKNAPSRIVNTSALAYQLGTINLEDINLEKTENLRPGDAYSQSKLAVMLFTQSLAKFLEGSNVTVNAVHPGVVLSDAHRHMPFRQSKIVRWSFLPVMWFLMKGTKDGAQSAIQCAVAKEELGVSGKFYGDTRLLEPTDNAKDSADVADKLWDLSLQMTGLKLEEGSVVELSN